MGGVSAGGGERLQWNLTHITRSDWLTDPSQPEKLRRVPTASVRQRISLTLHGAIPKCILGPSVPSAPSLAFRNWENVNFSGCDGSVSQSDCVKWVKFHWRRIPPQSGTAPVVLWRTDAVGKRGYNLYAIRKKRRSRRDGRTDPQCISESPHAKSMISFDGRMQWASGVTPQLGSPLVCRVPGP